MRRLVAQEFDVMLCDIGLPGEDGNSLMRRTRTLRTPVGRIPALALSAFARDRDRQRARDAGFDGHLAKPMDPAGLIRTIIDLLGRRAATVSGAGIAPEAAEDVQPPAERRA
jgi:CheY-like chemotaxis protein